MPEPRSEAEKTRDVVLGLIGIALLACTSSSTIERRGGTAYSPVNEQRGGSLRYYEGSKSRDDVYREMFTYCGGQYEITSERDVNRGTNTTYSRYSYNTTSYVEHVIDFRCLDTPNTNAAAVVRITGDEWRIAQDTVARQTGCAQAAVRHEVASPTPGAKGYAVDACGQQWLCSAGNGVAACAPSGQQVEQQPLAPPPTPTPSVGVPPPPPPPSL